MIRPSSIRNRRRGSILQQGTSLVQAARFLDVDHSTLMALQRGQIPTTKKNGRTVVSQGALEDV